MTRLLFLLFVYPLSLLPLPALYVLSAGVNLVISRIVRYRRKVIDDNLRNAFPEKSGKELRRLRNLYYRHLSVIIVEMVKMMTISSRSLRRHYRCANPELANRFFERGRSVILVSGHYNNWEWMIAGLDRMFRHHGVGIGKENSDKVFEKLVNRARSRFGTEIVFADTVRECFRRNETLHTPTAYMMLCDQSPNNRNKCYVTDFFHRRTGFIYGPEHFARKYGIPVLYYRVVKERIGRYRVELQLIAGQPDKEPEYAITRKYAELLEKTIREQPQYWLWSHRRWKFDFSREAQTSET